VRQPRPRLLCAVGQHRPPTAGASACTACAAGYFVSTAGATACVACPVGSACPTAIASTQCTSGYFSGSIGRTACTKSPQGHYVATAGASASTPCPNGTYNANEGATGLAFCVGCTAGQLCPAGSAAPNACGAGTYAQNGVCISCTQGSYCPAGASTPTPCSAGTYTTRTNAAQQSDCTDASAGYYVSTQGSSTQTACIAGTYQDQTGKTACKTCNAGGSCASSALTTFTLCPAGSYSGAGAISCTPVDTGFYSGNGDTVQSVCPAGSACPNGVRKACAPGTYSPNPYATACLSAPAGTYVDVAAAQSYTLCPASTYNPDTGATSITACLACGTDYTCPAGSVARNNNPTCAAGSYILNGACVACSAGQFCPLGSIGPKSCPPGTFSAAGSASACTNAPAGSFVSGTGQQQSTLCAAGTYSPQAGASACAACTPGTFGGVITGRSAPCPACAANSYCETPAKQTACPANTNSSAGASSQLGCWCQNGFACKYTKKISATVTLNVSLADWDANRNNVKTAFIAAVAAGAGVDPTKIFIGSVVNRTPPTGGRRLFSVEAPQRLRSTRELRDARPKEHIRVSFEVHGVDRRHDVRRGLARVLAGVF
jgi:hypothetical protein